MPVQELGQLISRDLSSQPGERVEKPPPERVRECVAFYESFIHVSDSFPET